MKPLGLSPEAEANIRLECLRLAKENAALTTREVLVRAAIYAEFVLGKDAGRDA